MTAPNPSTALARVLIDELVRNGLEHVVLAPGSRSTPLVFAALERRELSVHVEIDERSAAFLAVGIGRASGEPAAVLTTSGTAAANLFPAVVEADTDGVPMLLLTADRPPELRHAGANQTIDQIKLYGDKVRWFCEVGPPEDLEQSNRYWRSVACQAVAESRGGQPGPVHLNLAFREPLVPLADDGRTVSEPFGGEMDGRPNGAPWTEVRRRADLKGGGERIEGRVLVVLGHGAPAHGGLGGPVIAEPHSGGRVPGVITTAHHLLASESFFAGHTPDTVVTVGRVGLSRNVMRLIGSSRRHIAVDPRGWGDPARRADRIIAELPVCVADEEWAASWNRAEVAARRALDQFLDAIDAVSEPRTARDVADSVPVDGTLFAASSMPIRDLDLFMRTPSVRVLSNRGASGIDGFVSSVLGAAIVEAPVVALAGDLSLLHDQNGFLLQERPDCVFVVVNNDGGGIFSLLPQSAFPAELERAFATPHGRDLALLAEFHGLVHRRIDAPGEVATAVANAAAGPGLHLIEVRTQRSTNADIHRRATAAVVTAIESGL